MACSSRISSATQMPRGRAKSAAFRETAENFDFIFLVNKGIENPYTFQ